MSSGHMSLKKCSKAKCFLKGGNVGVTAAMGTEFISM